MKALGTLFLLSVGLACVGALTARSYRYDSAGRLTLAVYENGEALQYVYTRGDNLREVRRILLPAAPSGLAVTREFETRAKLSWVDNSEGETGFAIQRRLAHGSRWATVAEVAADADSYIDESLSPTSNYVYRVMALSSHPDGFTSAYSSEVIAAGDGSVSFAVSAFELLAEGLSVFALTFESSAAIEYELESATDLAEGNWSRLGWSASPNGPFVEGPLAGAIGPRTVYVRLGSEPAEFLRLAASEVE
jgi:YD repeat-containing protein